MEKNMEEKLYIDAIVTDVKSGYKTLTVMRLPAEEAYKKADLATRIEKESKDIKKESKELKQKFQTPEDKFDCLEERLNKAYKDKISPLYNQHSAIKGPYEWYVVKDGEYKVDHILDKVPENAVSADEFFKNE